MEKQIISLQKVSQKKRQKEILRVVNRAYFWSEQVMWKEDHKRITVEEIEEMEENGNLIVIEQNEKIQGIICVKQLSADTASLGTLAVDDGHLGKGLGQYLVNKAELWAIEHELMTMELEIVRSYEVHMPHKDRLHRWYMRLGYSHFLTAPLEKRYPQLVPALRYEGVCEVFRKKLV